MPHLLLKILPNKDMLRIQNYFRDHCIIFQLYRAFLLISHKSEESGKEDHFHVISVSS